MKLTMRKRLEELDSYLYAKFCECLNIAEVEWLPAIIPSSGSYNSFPHLLNVEIKVDELLNYAKFNIEEFTAAEIYILLSAIFLHDIGKTHDDSENHYEISAQMILNNWAKLRIESESFAQIISDIAYYHDCARSKKPGCNRECKYCYPKYKSDVNKDATLPEPNKVRSTISSFESIEHYGNIRTKTLAALLLLGDRLDGAKKRTTPEYVHTGSLVNDYKREIRQRISDNRVDINNQMICTVIDTKKGIDLLYIIYAIAKSKGFSKFSNDEFIKILYNIVFSTEEIATIDTLGETIFNYLDKNESIKIIKNNFIEKSKLDKDLLKEVFNAKLKNISCNFDIFNITPNLVVNKLTDEFNELSLITNPIELFKIITENNAHISSGLYSYKNEVLNRIDKKNVILDDLSKIIKLFLNNPDFDKITTELKSLGITDLSFLENINKNLYSIINNNYNSIGYLAKIIESVYSNNKDLEIINNDLSLLGIPIKRWLLECNGILFEPEKLNDDLYTITMTLEPIINKEYLDEVLNEMIILSNSIFGEEYHSFDQLLNMLKEPIESMNKVKTAVKRIQKISDDYYIEIIINENKINIFINKEDYFTKFCNINKNGNMNNVDVVNNCDKKDAFEYDYYHNYEIYWDECNWTIYLRTMLKQDGGKNE